MLLYCQNHPQNAILAASQPYLRSTDWDPETPCCTHDPPLLLFHLEQELIFHCYHLSSVNVRNTISAYCKSFDIRACLHPSLTPATFPSSQTWVCSWEMPWTTMKVHTHAFTQDYFRHSKTASSCSSLKPFQSTSASNTNHLCPCNRRPKNKQRNPECIFTTPPSLTPHTAA